MWPPSEAGDRPHLYNKFNRRHSVHQMSSAALAFGIILVRFQGHGGGFDQHVANVTDGNFLVKRIQWC